MATTESGFAPNQRFWATLLAQGAGFAMLFILGDGTFTPKASIQVGLNWIISGMKIYLALSGIAFIAAGIGYVRERQLSHGHVDTAISICLFTDILLLAFLVCQQGGLCKSMFLPVLFLVPAAYLAVERPDALLRKTVVLLAIVLCIVLSYYVSVRLQSGITTLPVLKVGITDFQYNAHDEFDKALLIASVFSALTPLGQIALIQAKRHLNQR